MKIKSILKKGLTLSLVTAISGQALQANPLQDSLLNVSKSGTITERDSSGNIERTTYTTPSLYFKFGGTTSNLEPIVNVGAPGITAGCGGLSIKGMFGSIIGLDRLASMLKNAGASLAWGIAVGLIYSLPGIGSAFKMINNWAKKIQQLLANACQSGQALGRAMADKLDFNNNAIDNKVMEWSEPIPKLDQGLNSMLELFGVKKFAFNDDMILGMKDDEVTSDQEILENYKQLLINSVMYFSLTNNYLSNLLNQLSNTKAEAFINQVFTTNPPEAFSMATSVITYNNHNASAISLIDDIGLSTSNNSNVNLLQLGFKTALMVNLVGDLSITGEEALNQYIDHVKYLFNDSNSSLTTAQKKSIALDLNVLVTGQSKTWGSITVPKITPPDDNQLTNIVDLLYYGGDSNETAQITKAKDYLSSLTGLPFGMISFNGFENDGPNVRIISFYTKAPNKNNSDISWYDKTKLNFSTGGIFKQSEDAIDNFMENGVINETTGAFPIIVPGLYDKLRILQQTPKNKRDFYKNILVKYNAYHILKTVIGGLLRDTTVQTTMLPLIWSDGSNVRLVKKNIVTTDTQQKNYNAFVSKVKSNFSGIMNNLDKYIDKKYGSDKEIVSTTELNNIFSVLNKTNASRILRNSPSNK